MEENIPEKSERNYLSIQIGSQLINFYEDEAISEFTVDNAQRIADLECFCDENRNIKPVSVKVPYYIFDALDIYGYMERPGGKFSVLRDYNLHTPKDNALTANAYGFLSIPEGEGPFPCAILCHGSEGEAWKPEYMNSLAGAGIATLSLNRFSHRIYEDKEGNPQYVRHTKLDQLTVPFEAEIIQTLFAAKLMTTHPKIAPTKIGFMGWSRGGNVALECTLKENIDAIYPGFQPAFCVNYYAMPLIHRKDTPTSPLLFLHGANDDYTPVSRLADYVNFLLDENYTLPQNFTKQVIFESNAAKIVIYPQSGHAFDERPYAWNGSETVQGMIENFCEIIRFKWKDLWEESFQEREDNYMNMSNCCVRSLEDGTKFLDSDNNERLWSEFGEYLRSKITYGVTFEVNPKAGREALKEALDFIKRHTSDEI